MEWTPKNYKKLCEAVDLRISSLSIDRMKSDIKRHELYAKNTVTQGEKDRIEEMCEYEDGIIVPDSTNYTLYLWLERFHPFLCK